MLKYAFQCTTIVQQTRVHQMIIPSGTASCDVSVTVDIKVKILFRHLVVGAVLTQLAKRLIKRRRQFPHHLYVALHRCRHRSILSFTDEPAKAKSLPAGCLRNPSLAATSSCNAASDVLQPDRNRLSKSGWHRPPHPHLCYAGLVSVKLPRVDPAAPNMFTFSVNPALAESANLWRQSNENLRRTACRRKRLLLTFIGNGKRRNNGVDFFAFSEGSASKSLQTRVHFTASVCTSRYRDRYQSQQSHLWHLFR